LYFVYLLLSKFRPIVGFYKHNLILILILKRKRKPNLTKAKTCITRHTHTHTHWTEQPSRELKTANNGMKRNRKRIRKWKRKWNVMEWNSLVRFGSLTN